ncbi:MAG: NAD(P)H-dependent oxidoreductase subunit E [Planctomycetes bacterium]|nr:NAD(P)H-dependent oxidoreductase subunit E [Planctomycetota bacterium]
MDQTEIPKLGTSRELSETEIYALLDDLSVGVQSNLISVLQRVQDRLGYLPAQAIRQISLRTRIPLSRVYGVVSFYAQFYTTPHGRHTVRVCRGTACHVKGGEKVLNSIKRKLGIDENESTANLKYYLEAVACLGTCFLAPVMMIDHQYFGELTPKAVDTILDNYGTGK